MKCNYTRFENKQEPEKPNFKPLLPVQLVGNNGKSKGLVALIDSGADVSLAHAEYGRLLDIDIESGLLWNYGGSVDKKQGAAYIHQLHLIIPNHSSLDIEIGFTEDIADGIFLIGQRDFFRRYEVHFYLQKGYFEIINTKDKGYGYH